VSEIKESAFAGSGLESITFHEGLQTIGNGAFYQTKIKELVLPSTVTSIAPGAFTWCYNLETVTVHATTPPAIQYEGSYGEVFDYGEYGIEQTLIVPDGCIDAYKAAEGWKHFNIVGMSDVKVKLNMTEASVLKGKTLTLKATLSPETLEDKSVTWKSSNTKVATVTADGKVTGVKTGIATITCTSVATGLSATCKVTVGSIYLDKTEASILKGTTMTLTPTVYPTSLEDKSVTWKSSNTKVATVTADGKVTGVKTGIATITCTSNTTGLKTTCKVTVGSIYLDKTDAVIKKGKTLTLTPTVYPTSLEDKSVTWKSSNTKVATVSSTGKVKGVKTGIATITCTSNATGLKTTCKVTVGSIYLDKTEVSILKGTTMTLTPTVYPTSLEDKSVTWKSSNTKVATVSSTGKVKGVKTGIATITCTSNVTGLSATCKVTVGSIYLDKTEVSIVKGTTLTLTPSVYPTTLADKGVTWKSSDETVATVIGGKVEGLKAGTATITCTSNVTGLSATCQVTVTASSGTRSLSGDDDETTGIDALGQGETEPYDVYDLSGRKVAHQVTSLDGLPDGIYIVNGKKVLKK
jgi:uncharacterized protein YjdB